LRQSKTRSGKSNEANSKTLWVFCLWRLIKNSMWLSNSVLFRINNNNKCPTSLGKKSHRRLSQLLRVTMVGHLHIGKRNASVWVGTRLPDKLPSCDEAGPPSIIHDSLVNESLPQTGSGSIQPYLQGSQVCPTHRKHRPRYDRHL